MQNLGNYKLRIYLFQVFFLNENANCDRMNGYQIVKLTIQILMISTRICEWTVVGWHIFVGGAIHDEPKGWGTYQNYYTNWLTIYCDKDCVFTDRHWEIEDICSLAPDTYIHNHTFLHTYNHSSILRTEPVYTYMASGQGTSITRYLLLLVSSSTDIDGRHDAASM